MGYTVKGLTPDDVEEDGRRAGDVGFVAGIDHVSVELARVEHVIGPC
jgi:hypothetical protein